MMEHMNDWPENENAKHVTICFACALEALAEGKTPPTFDESPMQHATRVHPPGSLDPKRRQELEEKFADKVRGWAEGVLR